MAIKTKKITDLTTIQFSDGAVILGSKNGTTGKIGYEDVISVVTGLIKSELEKFQPTETSAVAVAMNDVEDTTSQDIASLQECVDTLRSQMSSLSKSYKELEKNYKDHLLSAASTNLELTEQIRLLTLDVEKLKSFVQALQKDGYLTLAEIRKAAADACPICNHTHEEETTTEA